MKWLRKEFGSFKASFHGMGSGEAERGVLEFLNDNGLKPENVLMINSIDSPKIVLFYYADCEL